MRPKDNAEHERRTTRRRFGQLAAATLGALPTAAVKGVGAQSAALPPAAEQAALNATAAERELVALINGLREGRGLPAMAHDAALSELARERSTDMAARQYFSHDIPDVGSAVEWALNELPEAREAAENLGRSNAANTVVIGALFSAWEASPGHLGNMLKPTLNRVGIGVVETVGPGETTVKLVTQLFAASDAPLAHAGAARGLAAAPAAD